jgi:cellulose biosynthesis protein BcsQ
MSNNLLTLQLLKNDSFHFDPKSCRNANINLLEAKLLRWLFIEERSNVEVIQNFGLGQACKLFKALGKEYDYIIFDTAPSVGGIQERAIYAADMVLIPTATEFLSMDGLAQMMELLTALRSQHNWNGKLAGILPTFYDDQTSESRESLTELKATFGDSVLAPIHRATVLRECPAEGKTIFEIAPASRSSREYEQLSREIVKRS